jgi:2-iminobutanoate/2-iminopropanoate deaminase
MEQRARHNVGRERVNYITPKNRQNITYIRRFAVNIINTSAAPAAIGPYSQGIIAGNFIFTSGQIPLTPDGKSVTGDISAQTERVLENLKAVIEAAGGTLCDVVKTTVFLTDMDDFAAMNTVYGRFFTENPPARSTIAVKALPKGAKVEIEAVAQVRG